MVLCRNGGNSNSKEVTTTAREFGHLCEKICQMVTDKLEMDVQGFIKDDVLLSHVIDEVIVFTKEVNDMSEIVTDSLPMTSLPISVLANDKIFSR